MPPKKVVFILRIYSLMLNIYYKTYRGAKSVSTHNFNAVRIRIHHSKQWQVEFLLQ